MKEAIVAIFAGVYFLLAPLSAFAQFSGWVDSVGPDQVTGWACGNSDGRAVWVHLYENSTYRISTTSNRIPRPDAAPLCAGQSYIGFSVSLPTPSAGPHTIKTYVSDSPIPSASVLLPGAQTFTMPSADFIGPKPFGVIEGLSGQGVSGWACDPDAPSSPLDLDVYIQFDRHGSLYYLTSGQTVYPRVIPPCGANATTAFNISFPPLPGGTHNIVVRARNVGPGYDNLLEKFYAVPYFTEVPYELAYNGDANFYSAPGCWRTPGFEWVNMTGCPSGVTDALWLMVISDTINTNGIPEPQSGYIGSPSRVRYDALPGDGMVFKLNTYHLSAPDMYPWDYNFQAMSTNLGGTSLSSVNELVVEARVGTRLPNDFYYYNPSLKGPKPGIETGNIPWIHAIIAASYTDTSDGNFYWVEVVPFHREAQGGTTLGFIGGPPNALNARLSITDSRLSNSIEIPSTMLLGESRTIRIDMKRAFQDVFPTVDISNVVFGNTYMGTEQYGRNRIALNLERLAVLPY